MEINSEIFRAYDIRGIVDKDLTVEAVTQIGQAIGTEALKQNQKTIIIARDGRLSGPKLSQALSNGIVKSGSNVINIGAVPTPVLYYATHVLETQSGVMLTGSHNPPDYNGLKVVINKNTLADEAIQNLYQHIVKNDLAKGKGQVKEYNILDQYVDRICGDVKLKKPLKIVMDCGNGITGIIAPQLFKKLGCEVIELFGEVDGNFPNHPADPSIAANLKDLIRIVREKQADLGFGFDGDGDRLGVVTNKGEIIWPDRVLILFAIDVLSRNSGAKIVYDVKCTYHLDPLIKEHGGEPIMCRTGHSFIKEKIKETGALMAGEMSGHMFFKERWYGFDDALYAGARLLEVLSRKDKSADAIFKELPDSVNTPELKVKIADEKKFAFMKRFQDDAKFPGAKIITIDGMRVEFPDSWGLVRPSNTTPCLVLRFEAKNEEALKRVQELFRQEFTKLDPTLQLPF